MDDESIGSCESFSKSLKEYPATLEFLKNYGASSEVVEGTENDFTKDIDSLQHFSVNNSILNEKLNELMKISKGCNMSDTPLNLRESRYFLGDILKWYFGMSHVSLTDITPDISDAENVFVSAEGLIISLYYSFGFEINSEISPQTLPYVYLFERFVNYLLEAGTKRVILIFLDDFTHILEKINSGLQLLRESLILHTKLNPDVFTSYHFSSWLSEEYQDFLKEQEPSIFILEDGSSISNLETLQVLFHTGTILEVSNEESEEENIQQDIQDLDEIDISTSLLSFALEMLSYSNVALFYKMERKGQRIMAFTYSSTIEPRFTEANKGIMKQSILHKLQDDLVITAEEDREDFETCYGTLEYSLTLKSCEYNIIDEIGSKKDMFILFAKSLIENSISDEDLEISKKDESIMHNITLILFFSKIILLSGYLKRYILNYNDRHYISNYMLQFRKKLHSKLIQIRNENDWNFYLSIFKSLESLFFSEACKQLRSLINNIDIISSLMNKNSINAEICDLNDSVLLEFLFYLIGYISINPDNSLNSSNEYTSLFLEVIGLTEEDRLKLEEIWKLVSIDKNESFFPLKFSNQLSKYTEEDNDKQILNAFGRELLDKNRSRNQADRMDINLLPLQSKFVIRVLSELGVNVSDNGQIKGIKIDTTNQSEILEEYLNQVIQVSGIRDLAAWEIDRPQETRPNSRQEYSNNKESSSIKLPADLEKKRQLRDNQRKQQFWFSLGQILTGNDKLQQTIVVNPFHVWNKLSNGKNFEKDKIHFNNTTNISTSSKAEEIRRKNEEVKLIKMKQDDENQFKNFEKKLNNILSKGDPESFMSSVYDVLIGVPRRTNEFGRFKGLSKSFKLPKSRCKILVRTIQTCISVLKSFKCSTLPEVSHVVKARSAICMTFRLVIETFNQYYLFFDKNDLSELVKVLIQMGFFNSAKNLVECYKSKIETDILNMNCNSNTNIEDTKSGSNNKGRKSQIEKKSNSKKDKKPLNNSNIAGDSNYSEYLNIYNYVKKFVEINEYENYEKINMSVPKNRDLYFQLRYMGADFERSTGSVADPRVSFTPDYWQKRILDIIDSGDSALVCAPTASGKTFICYYAMEQVLRFDNDSVVVFIAPTKALADQVHAEIAYRFGSKTYPNHSRISLLCKLSRDYSINIPTQCQILITLPFMLELLLMSTTYQQWVSKIKFVIFDEVHCINEAEGGVYWERILQLIPCPYLCLSATIGNPHAFYNWLQRIGKVPSSKVHLITYCERYADLSTLVYNDGDLYPLNPVTSLSFDRILYYGLPGDFYLPPNDGLDLYLSLRDILRNENNIINDYIFWLDPQLFFSGTPAITKRQYRWYLSTLLLTTVTLVQNKIITKEMWTNITTNFLLNPSITYQRKMIELAKKNDSNVYNMIMGVENIKCLLSNIDSDENSLNNSISLAKNAIITPLRPTSIYKSPDNFTRMVRKLQQENLLPCIIFNMERSVVEHLGQSLIEKLSKDHYDKYYGSEEAINHTKMINKRKQEQYMKDIQRRDMLLKLKTMSRQQREKQGIVIDESELQALEDLKEPIDIAEEYDPEFSFCDRKVMGGREREIQETLNSCEGRISPIFIEGLRRGIGIHHDGLSLRYRRAVETLYRMGYLCIIISTKTLALGVNMPCRTTVFVNDSITLTPLLYRQASGRAGRRGYDIQGSVIFWDISIGKRNRLLNAELPTIKGNFPVTPTTVLRTFMLFENILNEQSKNNITKERAVLTFKALVKFYRDSLYSIDYSQDFHKKLTATQFRFVVDLLRRFHVLDHFCGCTGYAGLVSHMFEYEGTNLLLSKLIHSGVLFAYLFNEDKNPINVNQNQQDFPNNILTNDSIQRLLILLAHVYLAKPMTRNSIYNIRRQIDKASLNNLKQKLLSGRIQHLLLSLPDYIQNQIDEFNNIVFENMRNSLIVTCSDVEYDLNEFELPLSNNKIIEQELNKNSSLSKDSSIASLRSSFTDKRIDNNSCIQSPFISLFGLSNNEINSTQQLIYSSRVKLNCTHDFLSTVRSDKVRLEKEGSNVAFTLVLLNSFLVDFYEYQKFSEIIKNNSIPSSEIFFLISDFKILLDRFLYSFNLKDLRQYQNLNIHLTKKTTEFYNNVTRLTETIQILYDNYRVMASKNDA